MHLHMISHRLRRQHQHTLIPTHLINHRSIPLCALFCMLLVSFSLSFASSPSLPFLSSSLSLPLFRFLSFASSLSLLFHFLSFASLSLLFRFSFTSSLLSFFYSPSHECGFDCLKMRFLIPTESSPVMELLLLLVSSRNLFLHKFSTLFPSSHKSGNVNSN
jgi:hypothetical protein